SLAVDASDAASGTLIFSALGLPAGIFIDPSSGVISGTVTVGDAGWYDVTIFVNDGTYSGSETFEWYLGSTVSITDPGAQINTVGDTVNLQIEANDANSGTLTYFATGLPTGLSIDTSSGLISGTINSGATAIGSFVTTITVDDGTSTGLLPKKWSRWYESL